MPHDGVCIYVCVVVVVCHTTVCVYMFVCVCLVVVVCHTTVSVVGQFLFTAQDLGLIGSDYAYFTFTSLTTSAVTQPWTAYNMTGQNLTYRMQAFYFLKQVIEKTRFISFRFSTFRNRLLDKT